MGERILKEATEKGVVAKKRVLSSVSLEVRRIRLKAREEVVSAVMDAVRADVEKGRKRDDYPRVLAALAAEALRVLEGEEYHRLRGQARSRAPRVRRLSSGAGADEEGRARRETHRGQERSRSSTAGGVQVGVPGGNVIFDNTVEARMYRYRDEIRAIIFEGVFSSEDRIQ